MSYKIECKTKELEGRKGNVCHKNGTNFPEEITNKLLNAPRTSALIQGHMLDMVKWSFFHSTDVHSHCLHPH